MIVIHGSAGVATSIGDVFPGAAVDLPAAEALRLIARGRASADVPVMPADTLDSDAPVVPVVAGKPAAKRSR